MDWAARYRTNDTPWDLGGPHPELRHRLDRGDLAPRGPTGGSARALVPGCGRGHDALALAQSGWVVNAIDLVDDLAALVGSRLAPLAGSFLLGDALAFQAPARFDLFWEHTFFAALDPSQRSAWGALASRALRTGGRVCAIAFPTDRPLAEGGPPWRTTAADLATALGADFRLTTHEPVAHAAPGRRWQEEWVVFERVAEQATA